MQGRGIPASRALAMPVVKLGLRYHFAWLFQVKPDSWHGTYTELWGLLFRSIGEGAQHGKN
jgi:hypothetical protein